MAVKVSNYSKIKKLLIERGYELKEYQHNKDKYLDGYKTIECFNYAFKYVITINKTKPNISYKINLPFVISEINNEIMHIINSMNDKYKVLTYSNQDIERLVKGISHVKSF